MDRRPSSYPQEYDEPAHKARRSERVDVDGTANLNPKSEFEVEVKVRNVSSCGFMAECAVPVQIGSYVSLEIPGIGPVQAQVRWQIGVRMGGMFLDPISLKNCEWTAVRKNKPAKDA